MPERFFYSCCMKPCPTKPNRDQQQVLDEVRVRLVQSSRERRRCNALLKEHHYLRDIKPVGEQRWYVAEGAKGAWLAVLVFCGPAKHLRHRDTWIGWSRSQQRARLSLLANNARFCLLKECPNLATRVMRLTLDRLSQDWERKYGHPILAVETFVDPERFSGASYRAGGWIELGPTAGYGRCRKDYYVAHEKPKRLYVRELRRNARRSLQADRLSPALAKVEEQVVAVCTHRTDQLRSLVSFLKQVPDFRARITSYPIWSLLGVVACAHLCGAPRGQKDLAAFARRLTQAQRRALGIRRDRQGRYPAPSQPTFSRLLCQVDPLKVEEAILAFQRQVRGECPPEEMVLMDGKELRHSQGTQLLTAVSARTHHYLGSRPVAEKTNEIPVAQALIPELDLEGRLVSLDALHTQDETARMVVLEGGGDYLFTVKRNRPTQRNIIAQVLGPASAGFSPSTEGAHTGDEPESSGDSQARQCAGLGRTGMLSARCSGGDASAKIGGAKTRNDLSADQLPA